MWSITARSQSLQLLLQTSKSCTMHPVTLVGSQFHVAAPYMCSRSLSIARQRSRSRHGVSLTVAMAKPWRPDMNDVDRLSRGDGARRRGTGNFNIPHRLNQDERPVYEAAKKKGFLSVKGTGYRKQRKGHPLPNIYRQWCDAHGQATVVIEQDASGDCVVVDLATLRLLDTSQVKQSVREAAQELGLQEVHFDERPADAVPFDIIPYITPDKVPTKVTSSAAREHPEPAAAASPEDVEAAQAAVDEQGALIRTLKAQGATNQSPEVQKEVQELLARKARLEQLLQTQQQDARAATDGEGAKSFSTDSSKEGASAASRSSIGSGDHSSQGAPGATRHDQEHMTGTSAQSSSSSDDSGSDGSSNGKQRQGPLDDEHPLATLAIWQIPAQPLFFAASRPAAKELAKRVAAMNMQ